MYNHITGTVVVREPTRVVLEAGGVGYEAQVPLSASRRVAAVGQPATLLVHLLVKEDDLRLVGFMDEDERRTFRRLIKLSGVGPAMALQILSALSPFEFAQAVDRQDAAALKRVKGIGDKLAKRIILELKGAKARLGALIPPAEAEAMSGGPGVDLPPTVAAMAADAVSALEAMGMTPREADDRVARVLSGGGEHTLESLIIAALR